MASPIQGVPLEVVQLAERGARVFPLAPHSKKPLVDNWQNHNNTSDPQELAQIARDAPDCNWAMVCGKPSGIFALDYDVRNGRNGIGWYQHQLEEHGPDLADTIRVRTPSGGLHTYYTWIEGIGKDNTGKLAEGVDIQGNGSYVVIPPSIVDGKQYRFEDCNGETTIAPLPNWLRSDLLDRVFAPPPPPPPREPKEKTGRIPAGHRHNTLAKEAGRLCHAHIGREGLLAHFREINTNWFQEPYPDDELVRQASDMYRRWSPGNGTPTIGGLTVQMFDTIERKDVEWLWKVKEDRPGGLIPFGMMSLLSGDPDAGKTWIALSLAARVTLAGMKVLYMTLENPPDTVLCPRFDALGGDSHNIGWAKAVEFEGAPDMKRTISLQDIDILQQAITGFNPSLIIIDPLQSFLGRDVDFFRANQTRPVLDGLQMLIEGKKIAILLLRHCTKALANRLMFRGQGSIDFTAAVRSELVAGEVDKRRIMAQVKCNLCEKNPPLEYQISSVDPQGHILQTGFFQWLGETELTAADLNAPEMTAEERTKIQIAEEFLREFLIDGELQPKQEIEKAAARKKIALITLRRAKDNLKLESDWIGRVMHWRLPAARSKANGAAS